MIKLHACCARLVVNQEHTQQFVCKSFSNTNEHCYHLKNQSKVSNSDRERERETDKIKKEADNDG